MNPKTDAQQLRDSALLAGILDDFATHQVDLMIDAPDAESLLRAQIAYQTIRTFTENLHGEIEQILTDGGAAEYARPHGGEHRTRVRAWGRATTGY